MHMEYMIKLPDHAWVVAKGHKLIPSVYAACLINDSLECVTYSGPTFISIRSAKYDSSTAAAHVADFDTLAALNEFANCILTSNNLVKPIVFITVDGSPDENPRYPKTLASAIYLFDKYDLDAIFMTTNAPGHSAYNAVERRMALLSHDLSGLILPYDSYGTHLNARRQTIDDLLEQKNFERAGRTLAEIWSRTVIDNHPVVAQFTSPESRKPDLKPEELDETWKANHIRQSQYALQVVKCCDENCCTLFRTNCISILPSRFLPAPVPFVKREGGVFPGNPDTKEGIFCDLSKRLMLDKVILSHEKFGRNLPFDFYCSSVQSEIDERVCYQCELYFPSKVAKIKHVKVSWRFE